MSENTSRTGRLVMSIIAVLTGLALVIVVPKLNITVMNTVLEAVEKRIMLLGEPTIVSAKKIFTFFFSFWTGLTIFAGGLLALISVSIYKGDKWSRPIALSLLAIPSIAGAYMFGPVMLFAKNLLSSVGIVIMLGLIPYFIILLWERSLIKDKLVNFILFLFIGIESAYSFTNGHSSLRMLLGWGDNARTNEYFFYAFGIPIIWVGVILAIVGIPLFAGRRYAGWWLVTGGSLSMFIGTTLFYIAKPGGWFTAGLFLTLISFVLLAIPFIGKRPINKTLNENFKVQVNRAEEI